MDDYLPGYDPSLLDDMSPAGQGPWQASSFEETLDSLSSSELTADLKLSAPVEANAVDTDPGRAEREALLEALGELQTLLDRLTAGSSSNHKAFLMIHRLLKRGRNLPPAMVQSMQPYLYDLMNELLPRLHEVPLEPHFGHYANRLIQDCQLLCQPHFTADELRTHVAPAIESIAGLLDELRSRVTSLHDQAYGY